MLEGACPKPLHDFSAFLSFLTLKCSSPEVLFFHLVIILFKLSYYSSTLGDKVIGVSSKTFRGCVPIRNSLMPMSTVA